MSKVRNFFFLTMAFLLIYLSPAFAETETQKFRQAQYIMGTVFQIEVYSDSPEQAGKALKETFAEIRKLDLIMSNYNPDSELSFLVENAWKQPVRVSPELYNVLEKSLYFAELSGGLFDITIEPLVELWGFKSREYRKPDDTEISAAIKSSGYKNIILERGYVYFKKKGLKIDLGAIGKGYAVDKAAEVLKKNGITSGIVDAVSNQYFIGAPPGKNIWTVGIKHPREKETVIRYLEIKDKAVSTSGDYEQFFMLGNKRYSHILNPKTGYPVEEAASATVISENGTDADALSTILLLLNDKEIKSIQNHKDFKAVKVINTGSRHTISDF